MSLISSCAHSFDFNVYSYDSELTVGAEYWLRASPRSSLSSASSSSSPASLALSPSPAAARAERALRAPSLRDDTSLRAPPAPPSTPALSLRETPPTATLVDTAVDLSPRAAATLRDPAPSEPVLQLPDPSTQVPALATPSPPSLAPLLGVIKARLSSSGALALLWEGRLRNTLLSIGFKADLSPAALSAAGKMGPIEGAGGGGGGKVLKGVGLELLYFTSSEEAREEMGRRKERG